MARISLRLDAISVLLTVALLTVALARSQNAFAKVFAMSIKSTTAGPQLLELRGGTQLEAVLPAGYRLGMLPLGDRITYMFLGPDDKNGEHAVMTVDVLPVTAKMSSSQAAFKQVFSAYSVGSNDFKSALGKPLLVNGMVFDKASFEGAMEGSRSKGFAVVARIKQGFCIMVARDKEQNFKKSEAIMVGIVNSCKFKKQ